MIHQVLRALRALVLAPLVWCCSPHVQPLAPASPAVVPDAQDLAVSVALVDGDGDPFCVGTWISKMFVLTAAHCVRDENQDAVHVQSWDGATVDAKVLRTDDTHDLALLFAQNAPQHAFTHVASTWRQGEALTIVGHPGGVPWVVLHGWLAKAMSKFDTSMLWVQAPIWFGNSGGGAFNAAGELVGVGSRVNLRMPDQGWYVAADEIQVFLLR